MDTLNLSASAGADHYVDEGGLLASPDASHSEYDYMAGDDSSPHFTQSGISGFDNFDFNEFLTDDIGNSMQQQQQQHGSDCRRGIDLSLLPELATEDSSEDPFLQPPAGAALEGCDVGGIAVGQS
jgi:transcriptional activator HAC1